MKQLEFTHVQHMHVHVYIWAGLAICPFKIRNTGKFSWLIIKFIERLIHNIYTVYIHK